MAGRINDDASLVEVADSRKWCVADTFSSGTAGRPTSAARQANRESEDHGSPPHTKTNSDHTTQSSGSATLASLGARRAG